MQGQNTSDYNTGSLSWNAIIATGQTHDLSAPNPGNLPPSNIQNTNIGGTTSPDTNSSRHRYSDLSSTVIASNFAGGGFAGPQQGVVADFNSIEDIGPPNLTSTMSRRYNARMFLKPVAKLIEIWNDPTGPIHKVLVFLGERDPPPPRYDTVLSDSFYANLEANANDDGSSNRSEFGGHDTTHYVTAANSSFFSVREDVSDPGYGPETAAGLENGQENPYADDTSWWWYAPAWQF